MKVSVFNIKWDTSSDDDEGDAPSAKSCGLPSECEIEVDYDENNEDFWDEVGDTLSDKYGFCFYGFNYLTDAMKEKAIEIYAVGNEDDIVPGMEAARAWAATASNEDLLNQL